MHRRSACAQPVWPHRSTRRRMAHVGMMTRVCCSCLLRLAPTRRFDATANAPPVHERCLGQILVGGEIVHKGQGQAAKALGILPVTAGTIERVMAPDELRPVRWRLALMGGKRMEFLLSDRADINVPLGVKGPATPQGAICITRPDLGEGPATGVDVF